MPPTTYEQIVDTCKRMADEARYRPAAPSDGLGNITVPSEELDLEAEADKYARRWNQEEDSRDFHVGVCNFPTRPATIFAIEAARSMCGGVDDLDSTYCAWRSGTWSSSPSRRRRAEPAHNYRPLSFWAPLRAARSRPPSPLCS
jgi:hypothetical protein